MIENTSDEPCLLVVHRIRDKSVVEILSLGNGELENHEFEKLKELAGKKGYCLMADQARECADMEDLMQHFKEMIDQP